MKTIIIISSLIFIIVFYGMILNFLAKILGAVLTPFNAILVAWKYRKVRGFLKVFNKYNFDDAIAMDIYLHYDLRTLLNATMSKGGVPFGIIEGNPNDETLSSRIGCKKIKKSLTVVGLFIYYFLMIIDVSTWRKGGHCMDAYNNYLNNKNG